MSDSKEPKPIFLLADSQLLFWRDEEKLFLLKVKNYFDKNKKIENLKAAYIGASNDDHQTYYDIFKTAMEQIGVINCRMIPSKPEISDIDFLDLADLILLAGGDVKRGWDILKKNKLDKKIVSRYHDGAIIMGVSAGAIQLGLKGWNHDSEDTENLFDTFKIVPYMIDVHDENNEWKRLEIAVENSRDYCKGFGIPAGGGVIFYPDWSIEAVRHSLTEIIIENVKIKQSVIIPPSESNRSDHTKILQIEDEIKL